MFCKGGHRGLCFCHFWSCRILQSLVKNATSEVMTRNQLVPPNASAGRTIRCATVDFKLYYTFKILITQPLLCATVQGGKKVALQMYSISLFSCCTNVLQTPNSEWLGKAVQLCSFICNWLNNQKLSGKDVWGGEGFALFSLLQKFHQPAVW